MKQIITSIILAISAFLVRADLILLRDGSEILASVQQISDDRIVYQPNKNHNSYSIDTRDVYMIKFDKRGNVYITPDRKRITGEKHIVPKGVDLVYLVEGGEYIAYDLRVGHEKITFLPTKPGKKSIPVAKEFDRKQVFKIRYADGTTDIISSLTTPEPAKDDTGSNNDIEPEYQVVFHTVAKKETLAIISKKYGVTPQDIISWNELSTTLRPTSILTPGKQLMLYIKP